jgi:hypothetical protein
MPPMRRRLERSAARQCYFLLGQAAERNARQEAAGPVSNQTARQGCTGAAGVEAVRTSPRDTETGIARQIHISLERLGADREL